MRWSCLIWLQNAPFAASRFRMLTHKCDPGNSQVRPWHSEVVDLDRKGAESPEIAKASALIAKKTPFHSGRTSWKWSPDSFVKYMTCVPCANSTSNPTGTSPCGSHSKTCEQRATMTVKLSFRTMRCERRHWQTEACPDIAGSISHFSNR